MVFGPHIYRLGESVVIPRGQNILLDASPPQLQLIILEGTLQFEDIKDVHLQASYIFVRGGHLIIGTEDNPHQNKVFLSIHPCPSTFGHGRRAAELNSCNSVLIRQPSPCMAIQTQRKSCLCMVQRILLLGMVLLTCMASQRNPHGHN